MARDQDLFVVNGISGHQFVLNLEPLSSQREGGLHVRLGMTLMALLLFLVIGGVDGACGYGGDGGQVVRPQCILVYPAGQLRRFAALATPT